jgi:protein phosphatase
MRIVSAGLSDIGRKRPHNEDSLLCDDDLGLYVVADGVGGHAKGEVASAEAVEQLAMWVRRHVADMDRAIALRGAAARTDIRRLLEGGMQSACYMVFGLAEQDPEKRGMSTTMSVLLMRGGHAFVGQVGDSRVYRLRNGHLTQLTEDHTLVNYELKHGLITAEEARTATKKNVITRAVGHKDYVQVDTFDDAILPHDRYFLCTDGFHGYIEDEHEITRLMTTEPIEQGVMKAIDAANDLGGRDNITVLITAVRP